MLMSMTMDANDDFQLIKSLSAPARQANASHHEIERVLQENKATFFFKLVRLDSIINCPNPT